MKKKKGAQPASTAPLLQQIAESVVGRGADTALYPIGVLGFLLQRVIRGASGRFRFQEFLFALRREDIKPDNCEAHRVLADLEGARLLLLLGTERSRGEQRFEVTATGFRLLERHGYIEQPVSVPRIEPVTVRVIVTSDTPSSPPRSMFKPPAPSAKTLGQLRLAEREVAVGVIQVAAPATKRQQVAHMLDEISVVQRWRRQGGIVRPDIAYAKLWGLSDDELEEHRTAGEEALAILDGMIAHNSRELNKRIAAKCRLRQEVERVQLRS